MPQVKVLEARRRYRFVIQHPSILFKPILWNTSLFFFKVQVYLLLTIHELDSLAPILYFALRITTLDLSQLFPVGEGSRCVVWHFHELSSTVVHLHIVIVPWDSLNACATLSKIAYVHCSATSIETLIPCSGHYRAMC